MWSTLLLALLAVGDPSSQSDELAALRHQLQELHQRVQVLEASSAAAATAPKRCEADGGASAMQSAPTQPAAVFGAHLAGAGRNTFLHLWLGRVLMVLTVVGATCFVMPRDANVRGSKLPPTATTPAAATPAAALGQSGGAAEVADNHVQAQQGCRDDDNHLASLSLSDWAESQQTLWQQRYGHHTKVAAAQLDGAADDAPSLNGAPLVMGALGVSAAAQVAADAAVVQLAELDNETKLAAAEENVLRLRETMGPCHDAIAAASEGGHADSEDAATAKGRGGVEVRRRNCN